MLLIGKNAYFMSTECITGRRSDVKKKTKKQNQNQSDMKNCCRNTAKTCLQTRFLSSVKFIPSF